MQKIQEEVIGRNIVVGDQKLTVQILGPESEQEWTTDPDMLEVYLDWDTLNRAARVLKTVKRESLDSAQIDLGMNYEVYELAENRDPDPVDKAETVVGPDSKTYVPVETEYRLTHAVLCINQTGYVALKVMHKDSRDYLYATLGTIDELLTAAGISAEPASAADQFVEDVANLSIWSYDRDDGKPYEECEEPDDGFMDSHEALMGLIEKARNLRS